MQTADSAGDKIFLNLSVATLTAYEKVHLNRLPNLFTYFYSRAVIQAITIHQVSNFPKDYYYYDQFCQMTLHKRQ